MQYHNGGQQLKHEHYFLQNYYSQNFQPSNILRCTCTVIARMKVNSVKFSRAANLQKNYSAENSFYILIVGQNCDTALNAISQMSKICKILCCIVHD